MNSRTRKTDEESERIFDGIAFLRPGCEADRKCRPTSEHPKEKVSIWRFMVDKEHQQKSIGRVALGLALHEIKQIKDLKEIEICYNPNNIVAKGFYSSFGFVEVGMDVDGKDMRARIMI